jgi:D-alanyl-D-alanine carboxypeptidase/D-alanyl-D-alanine-endopeptidase (penicillin-binding protein 4)
MEFLRCVLFVLTLGCTQSYAGSAIDSLNEMDASALLVLSADGRPLYSKQAEQMFIPASTVKLLTALMALEHWGREHRFSTEFYIEESDNTLVVKGLGDPFLVSEEIDLIVEKLKQLDIQSIRSIQLDLSYFDESLNDTKQATSNNPYDASASALAANFNTIEVNVVNGVVTSGEAQTPITGMAKSLAKGLANGKHRINLGHARRGPQYFVELLSEKLTNANIRVEQTRASGSGPRKLTLLFTHYNSHPLDEVIAAMLKFSNNFIANQLFLMLGAEKFAAPAVLDKSRQRLKEFVEHEFQWQQFAVYDGAGLSRNNRLSAHQLAQVAQRFAPYSDLMPTQNKGIRAKSGTLNGISCYVGYVLREGEWLTFALLINQPVEYRFRERLAEQLITIEF